MQETGTYNPQFLRPYVTSFDGPFDHNSACENKPFFESLTIWIH